MINTNNSKTTGAIRSASAQTGTPQNGSKDAQTSRQSSGHGNTTWLKVLTVEEYESADGKAARRWTQIGVAFPHKEGGGLNVELRCLPLNGRLVILPPDEDDGTGR